MQYREEIQLFRRLKSLICPIFATGFKQQQTFSREFDLYFKFLEPLLKAEKKK